MVIKMGFNMSINIYIVWIILNHFCRFLCCFSCCSGEISACLNGNQVTSITENWMWQLLQKHCHSWQLKRFVMFVSIIYFVNIQPWPVSTGPCLFEILNTHPCFFFCIMLCLWRVFLNKRLYHLCFSVKSYDYEQDCQAPHHTSTTQWVEQRTKQAKNITWANNSSFYWSIYSSAGIKVLSVYQKQFFRKLPICA